MSDHHHHDNSSGFLNGLILGAIIGAGVAFFLGSKKGEELAHEISQKGLSLLDDFGDTFEEIEEDDQVPTPAQISSMTKPISQPAETQKHTTDAIPTETNGNGHTNGNGNNPSDFSHIETLQTQGRRLFHGIPKKR